MADSPPSWGSRALDVFRSGPKAVSLVYETDRRLLVLLGSLTLVLGLVPAAIAAVGRELVDAVVAVSEAGSGLTDAVLLWVAVELGLVMVRIASNRTLDVSQSLLRAKLGHAVNRMILDKALTLPLPAFEDSATYDALTAARREASSRPLALVRKTFGLLQNLLSLVTYGALLVAFSPLAVLLLFVTAVPAFVAETKYSGEAFRLFKWRNAEKRQQAYLEMVVAREDSAKEVQLLGIGRRLVDRYSQIFWDLYAEDRSLAVRRGAVGGALSIVSAVALYAAYAWIATEAAYGRISLGEMTMYLLLFKQGQSAFAAILKSVGGLYEDNLYLSTLNEFLELDFGASAGSVTEGSDLSEGIRFHNVTFTYPGASEPAIRSLSLHLPPGQRLALVGHNGSGKTTLVKLLTRLYLPDSGTITLDGVDLRDWEERALRERVGVIFQDFVRYQFKVGENIGVGDSRRVDDEEGWADAAEQGMAAGFIDDLDKGYHTQLGRWFKDGRELSGGQWQKVALSRAFMRKDARVIVLDEPTAAMDAEAEAMVFERVRELADDQMAILISHRFSTVRMADRIVVLEGGTVVEEGTHAELMELDGRYAHLFLLQAEGYR